MVWDTAVSKTAAKKQGFFKNKDGLAEKPTRVPPTTLTTTMSGNSNNNDQSDHSGGGRYGYQPLSPSPTTNAFTEQQQQQQNTAMALGTMGYPVGGGGGGSSSAPILSQSPRPANYSTSNINTNIIYGGGGGGMAFASIPQQQHAHPNTNMNNYHQQYQGHVDAHASPSKQKGAITDKITGARTWSTDQISRVLPPAAANCSPQQQRNRASSLDVVGAVGQNLPPSHQQYLGNVHRGSSQQPLPLPSGYDPRASLTNTLSNSPSSKQQQQHQYTPQPPPHLPPLQQPQPPATSSPIMYNNQQQSQGGWGGGGGVQAVIPANGYQSTSSGFPTASLLAPPPIAIVQISPAPASDLVQLVHANYQEAQRSYLQI